MLNTRYFIGCLLAASMLAACSKKESYDIKGDPEVKFFTNNEALGNAPQNSISYDIVNIPGAAGGFVNLSTTLPAVIRIPVYATRPVGQDVAISAELDNSLIEAYNAEHNTNYAAFPDGMLNTNALLARITSGASTSVDSISIPANLSVLNTLTGTNYMAPIRLTTVSNPAVGGITQNSSARVTYVLATVEQRKINYGAGESDVQGSLVADRAPWTVTYSEDPSTLGDIFDGSTNSYSRFSSSQGEIIVNMQAVMGITGIRIYSNSSSFRAPNRVDVSLSTDGVNYEDIGSVSGSNLAFESGYNYIVFYGPMQAQYVKLKIYYSSSGSSANRRLAEFDVYTN